MAERPLEQIRKETKTAHRAPHLRKNNQIPADQIDSLDNILPGGTYHHEGPYDATLATRNKNKLFSPVEATRHTNAEALKATPRENVQDSLTKHVPLAGTAVIPPGMEDPFGRRMDYEEGTDLMRERDAPGGPYKRYEHVQYHPDDLKGKGEPSYSIERGLKEHALRDGENGTTIEMQAPRHHQHHSRHSSKNSDVAVRQRSDSAGNGGPSSSSPRGNHRDVLGETEGRSRSNSGGKLDGLKRRIGSLRRKSP